MEIQVSLTNSRKGWTNLKRLERSLWIIIPTVSNTKDVLICWLSLKIKATIDRSNVPDSQQRSSLYISNTLISLKFERNKEKKVVLSVLSPLKEVSSSGRLPDTSILPRDLWQGKRKERKRERGERREGERRWVGNKQERGDGKKKQILSCLLSCCNTPSLSQFLLLVVTAGIPICKEFWEM